MLLLVVMVVVDGVAFVAGVGVALCVAEFVGFACVGVTGISVSAVF